MELKEALAEVQITEADSEILDRVSRCSSIRSPPPPLTLPAPAHQIFTMLDKTGDDQVNFKDFITGVSPLIGGAASEKLQFSFELYVVVVYYYFYCCCCCYTLPDD